MHILKMIMESVPSTDMQVYSDQINSNWSKYQKK